MGCISYKYLVNSIKNGVLIIDEKDYSYNVIIKSIPRIKFICRLYGVNLSVLEIENRKINSLTDIATAINLKDKKELLNFIYDKTCDYLDYDFINKNKCVFKNNKCISDRNKDHVKDCGCCRSRNGSLCKYLVKGKCSIRNLGCKFFICPTLKKMGLRYKNKDFPLFNYFCNIREKIVLRYTIFIPKEKVIERCLRHWW